MCARWAYGVSFGAGGYLRNPVSIQTVVGPEGSAPGYNIYVPTQRTPLNAAPIADKDLAERIGRRLQARLVWRLNGAQRVDVTAEDLIAVGLRPAPPLLARAATEGSVIDASPDIVDSVAAALARAHQGVAAAQAAPIYTGRAADAPPQVGETVVVKRSSDTRERTAEILRSTRTRYRVLWRDGPARDQEGWIQHESVVGVLRRPTATAAAAPPPPVTDAPARDPGDPRSYPCTTCGAAPGRPCTRPSGHAVFGGGCHAPREHAARDATATGFAGDDPETVEARLMQRARGAGHTMIDVVPGQLEGARTLRCAACGREVYVTGGGQYDSGADLLMQPCPGQSSEAEATARLADEEDGLEDAGARAHEVSMRDALAATGYYGPNGELDPQAAPPRAPAAPWAPDQTQEGDIISVAATSRLPAGRARVVRRMFSCVDVEYVDDQGRVRPDVLNDGAYRRVRFDKISGLIERGGRHDQ